MVIRKPLLRDSFKKTAIPCSPAPRLPEYTFSPLADPVVDIRLINLLPLPNPLQTKDELESTLPTGWRLLQTTDYEYVFVERATGDTYWDHSNTDIDPSIYKLPEDCSPPGIKPRYEAFSYTWGSAQKTDFVLIKSSAEIRSLVSDPI